MTLFLSYKTRANRYRMPSCPVSPLPVCVGASVRPARWKNGQPLAVSSVKMFPIASCCYDTSPDIRGARRQSPQWRELNRTEGFPQWMNPHQHHQHPSALFSLGRRRSTLNVHFQSPGSGYAAMWVRVEFILLC